MGTCQLMPEHQQKTKKGRVHDDHETLTEKGFQDAEIEGKKRIEVLLEGPVLHVSSKMLPYLLRTILEAVPM